MLGYINAIKRGFRDQHGFTPTGGTEGEPLFDNIQPGVYPIVIDGKTDYVRITEKGFINCCNFEPPKGNPIVMFHTDSPIPSKPKPGKKWHPLKWQPYDYNQPDIRNPNGEWRAPYRPNGPVDQAIAMIVFLAFVTILAVGFSGILLPH